MRSATLFGRKLTWTEQEKYRRQRERDARSRLTELYRSGCPCGRSFAWHQRQRKEGP